MKSQATDVDSYLAAVPAERKPALERIRALCLELLDGYQEVMAYGMPGYQRDAGLEVAFASQKNHIALYIMKKDVLDRHRAALRGISVGKGCIRYASPAAIDFELVRKMVQESAESSGRIC